MNTVVLLGGAAATGKSTLTSALLERYGGLKARPSDSFFLLASERGVSEDEAFTGIIAREDAEDHYLRRCSTAEVTVADLHFAIQPRLDSERAVGRLTNHVGEDYVGALSNRLLDGLSAFRLIMVLLVAPAEVTFKRAQARDGVRRRAATLEDAQLDLDAELREFNVAVSRTNAPRIILDSSILSRDSLVDAVGSLL